MKPLQFSLAGQLGIVAFFGLAFAAVSSPSMLWAMMMVMLVWGVLLFAILGILFRRGERRAFWAGFAVFGWGYLAFLFVAWVYPVGFPLWRAYLSQFFSPYVGMSIPGETGYYSSNTVMLAYSGSYLTG